jgi:VanZ family protein
VLPAFPPRPLLQYLCLALAAAMAGQLFYLGSQPLAVGLFAEPWDKLAHFAVFSALTALLWIGTAGRMPLAVVAFLAALGALDEVHQTVLPGRSADTVDFIVDVGAVLVTAGVMVLYVSRHKKRDL